MSVVSNIPSRPARRIVPALLFLGVGIYIGWVANETDFAPPPFASTSSIPAIPGEDWHGNVRSSR